MDTNIKDGFELQFRIPQPPSSYQSTSIFALNEQTLYLYLGNKNINNIILQMEEAIGKLSHFFESIAAVETQTDQLRLILFNIPGAKRKIFQILDTQKQNHISCENIVILCNRLGCNFDEQDSEIIGRYFRNWGNQITQDQFWDILRPYGPSRSCYQQCGEQINPQYIFVQFVKRIISNYRKLEVLRGQVSRSWEMIVEHFATNYGNSETISKQNIKTFMINQDLYSREKYMQITNYIFGESIQEIGWESFLNLKFKETKNQADSIQPVECQPPEGYGKKLTPSCKNIQEILSRIEEMQKGLKEKKERMSKDAGCENVCLPQNRQKQNFVGKVVSRRKQKVMEFKAKQQEESQKISKSFVPKLYGTQHYRAKGKDQHTTFVKSNNMKRTVSEAQMKIDEIEKRAMDKYLSSRKNSYLPSDEHVPFYNLEEKGNFERKRQNSNEYWDKKLHSVLSPRNTPSSVIYTRNRVSRVLYNFNESGGFRPVSPRLLRY